MLSIDLRRSVATLAAIAGLLVAAAPAGATVTMLDFELQPVVTYNGHAGLSSK